MTKMMRQHHHITTQETGFSLVELMISITIGLLLLLGLVTLLVNTHASHEELQKSSAQIENGRYAMQLLHDDIQLAGYYGEYSPSAYDTSNIKKPCEAAATGTALPIPVGYDLSAAAIDLTCLSNLKSGTGILVLRRVLTTPATSVIVGATYLQVSQCNSDPTTTPFRFSVASNTTGTTSDGNSFDLRTRYCDSTLTPPTPLPAQLTPPSTITSPTAAAALRKFVTHIYYLSSCNVCSPTSDGIPTLKMVEYADGAAQTPLALVEGIEDMQFDYGLDTDADGSPDSYVADTDVTLTGTPANWANVVAVRVNLLARNLETSAGYDDTKTYALGLAKPSYTVPSGTARKYKRHLYTSLVRVENVSARRETP